MNLEALLPTVVMFRENNNGCSARSFIDAEYILCVMRNGFGSYTVENVEYRLGAGDMVLLAPRMLHIVQADPGTVQQESVIHFRLSCPGGGEVDTVLAERPVRTHPPTSLQNHLFRCVEQFRTLWLQAPGTAATWRMQSILLELLACYLELPAPNSAPPSGGGGNWRNLEDGIAYIHRHAAERIRIGAVAKAAHLSETYFCALFRRHTGTTIHRYINELKIYRAKRLLENSQLTLDEIAAEVGLGDIYAFCKIFRQYENTTPGKYRAGSRR